ncbi:type IX secretion system protein PorQ [Adhaeribacter sp. BT258]|uniref:Type IX secretion system protein PorQ n=1 Tax=Adhaeribacter terrigena TaxID=2793070 RepID=A0ABS1BY14_9BACT|nr:type IX secretion system protein PorQ [Adhaeribacter terrigena]MBK0401985.1 type IX secretion system protein PorQ [Adhaeribacter terrigena]
MRKIFYAFFTFFALNHTVLAQIGGQQSFGFLNLPGGAKTAGIGGVNVSSRSHDVTMLYANPALLNDETNYQLFFGHTDYLSDIRQNSLTFSFPNKQGNHWAAGIQYLNYGDFIQRDETGQEMGTFSVVDYTLNLTHARTIEHFTLGATAKMAFSRIAEYKSTAALVDLGGVFKHPEKDFTVGLALKNIGYQLKTYNGEREPMPFDAQIGMSYKLEHMPLKFSLTAHHLHKFDIVYLDTTATGKLDDKNQPIKPKKTFGDKLARHFVVGGEFMFSKNFNVRFGYNHLRRRELRTEVKAGGAGMSFGAMVRIRKFELDYSRAYYHVAGASNFFTVSTTLEGFFKKSN